MCGEELSAQAGARTAVRFGSTSARYIGSLQVAGSGVGLRTEAGLFQFGERRERGPAVPRDQLVVLCIDDNRSGLEIRKKMLEAKGFRVLTAPDGASGLEIASREEVDAVILDYRMPGMDGEEVAARLRERRRDIPILLLSGFRGTIPDSLLSSVDSFIEKGQPSGHLIAEVERITGKNSDSPAGERKQA